MSVKKMKRRNLLVALLVIVLPFFSLQTVYAAGSIFLNPADGVIDASGKSLDIVVDSGGEEINGLEMSIVYEGEIEFVDFESGNISGCDIDGLERSVDGVDDVFLYCFIMTDPYIGSSGIFATLNFEATGEGYAEVKILDVEGAGDITTGGIGSYTTTLSVQEETTETTPTTLPQTSLAGPFGLITGVGLLCIPFVLNNRPSSKRGGLMMRKVR
jgi:hypothetical protein